MKDYTKDIGFWKRLQSFVTDVQTNCCMGEEEKQMIIHNCNLKKNKMRPKLSKWYAVPPYRQEGWRIFNSEGELVAIFETQADCEKAVEVYNRYVDSENEKN